MTERDLVIIGAGPAGLSAAVAAYAAGVRDILLLERDEHLGGILIQCIHNGFGLHRFGEELTGPEYAARYEQMICERGIEYRLGTMVLHLSANREIVAMNGHDGVFHIRAKAIILAMGCRERSRGALSIPGSRPAGVYTAGTAQRYVNLKGELPGREVVILGSGDIGLIMARRLTLEGAKVKMVCELMPYSGGLTRNIVQCLDDFQIPLRLSHTVVRIHGKDRVEGVTIAAVDESGRPIPQTEEEVPCDTLLLSVGLLPENELTREAGIAMDPVTGGALVNENRETEADGIYACGNVLQVHDLVDYVSEEAEIAGRAAARRILGKESEKQAVRTILAGEGIRYTVPQRVDTDEAFSLYYRVRGIYRNLTVELSDEQGVILSKKLRRAAPGEMERLAVPQGALQKTGLSLRLSVKEAKA